MRIQRIKVISYSANTIIIVLYFGGAQLSPFSRIRNIYQTFALETNLQFFFSIYLAFVLVKLFGEKLQDDLFVKVELLQNIAIYGSNLQ